MHYDCIESEVVELVSLVKSFGFVIVAVRMESRVIHVPVKGNEYGMLTLRMLHPRWTTHLRGAY